MSEKIDISNIIRMSNEHPRVNILNPGVGVGGHCIPVDPLFLTNKFKYLKLIELQFKQMIDNQIIYLLN